jgi:LemA protein
MEPNPLLIFGIAVAALFAVWFLATFNNLVRARNHVRESWAGIDTELKRRYDLIPNLVETVKGYAAHERATLEQVIAARARAAASKGSPASQAEDENAFIASIRQLLAVVENYPDLKANENFLALQRELANTEDRIQAARRFYNANVRDMNNRVEMFPSSIIASLFTFRREEYFEIEDASIRQAPQVSIRP